MLADVNRIVPVILCGGAGTRLWPSSRESFPKQFFSFDQESSLFQRTVARMSDQGYDRPIVITGDEHRFIAADQLRLMNCDADILLEPCRRDTCAAVIAACTFIEEHRQAGSLAIVVAADHVIDDEEAFHSALQQAIPHAATYLMTFGIRPTRPATGYGYIAPGAALDGSETNRKIAQFVEKPDAETAARYVREGYLWNSGNFLFSTNLLLSEAAIHADDIRTCAENSVREATRDLDFIRLDPEAFGQSRALSIDYAILERSNRTAVVPCDFQWSDIGSWHAVWESKARDANGNVSVGTAVFQETKNSLVHSESSLTVLLGVDDLAVITTPDAVLVSTRAQSENVKQLAQLLHQSHPDAVASHRLVHRPWGTYETLDQGQGYLVKRIEVKPGATLSLQSHEHRAEHWVVVSGTARVTLDDKIKDIPPNHSIYVPIGGVHRIANVGEEPVCLIEVQTGAILDEDDIVRYDDVYNRT